MSKKSTASSKKASAKTKDKSQRKEIVLIIVALILCTVMIVATAGVYFVRNKLDMIGRNSVTGNADASFYYEDENYNYSPINDLDASTIKEFMKGWATNGGEKLYSKNVINVLLIGEDSEDGTSRSDSTILVSVNLKTKTITLNSVLRDSYTYMNINGRDRYDKTNHSYAWGGPDKLMEVISDNYKIQIDHYVSINYDSFINAIDALGGIRVMVTDAEARYMNRTTKMKGFESGENVLLDGKHALVFARIRKLDGEVERTERQRRLISAFIQSVQNASLTDLNKAIDQFLPYVSTNFTNNEIIDLGTRAITEGWLKFDIKSNAIPSEVNRAGVEGFRTYTGNLFVWIVDYVKEAQSLQLALYGTTNITIGADHSSPIDLVNYSLQTYVPSTEPNTGEYDTTEETQEESTEDSSGNWLEDLSNLFDPNNYKPTRPTFPSFGEETTEEETDESTEPSTEGTSEEEVSEPSTEDVYA